MIPVGEVNPPPPEGSERVQIVFEVFFEFFELKESSQAPRIPPSPLIPLPLGLKPAQQKLVQDSGSINKSIQNSKSFWSRFGCLLGPVWHPF